VGNPAFADTHAQRVIHLFGGLKNDVDILVQNNAAFHARNVVQTADGFAPVKVPGFFVAGFHWFVADQLIVIHIVSRLGTRRPPRRDQPNGLAAMCIENNEQFAGGRQAE